MRIPSGKTDQYIYFVAVDATDLVTRETGLSGFTVYRSRNGVAEVAYTTPTVTQIDATNMPGVYALLVDEDTTIASTSDSEEYCLHITCAGMAPVTRTIELYRRDTTTGNTALVDANGRVDVIKVAGTTQTAGDLAALITTVDDLLDTELPAVKTVVDAIKVKTDNLPTDPADQSLIIAATDALVTLISDVPTNAELATALGTADDAVLTQVALVKAKTDLIPASPAATGDIPSAASIANAVWDEAAAGHVGAGSTGEALSAIKAKTDNLPTDPADASVVAGLIAGVESKVDTIDGVVGDIKLKTDNLPANPAASSDIPSANANADALLDRANGVETGYTVRQTMRIMSAVLGGKSSGHPGSPVYRNLSDSADRVSATVSSGNRSAVTLNP